MARRPKPTPPAAWIRPGALADFRMVSGAPVTHAARRVLSEPWQLGSGDWVVKIEGVSGGVSCEPRFLTPAAPAVPAAKVEASGVKISGCRYRIEVDDGSGKPRRWQGDTVEGLVRDLEEARRA
jgi:hypothetical protein